LQRSTSISDKELSEELFAFTKTMTEIKVENTQQKIVSSVDGSIAKLPKINFGNDVGKNKSDRER
jgi:hypothetical protein